MTIHLRKKKVREEKSNQKSKSEKFSVMTYDTRNDLDILVRHGRVTNCEDYSQKPTQTLSMIC